MVDSTRVLGPKGKPVKVNPDKALFQSRNKQTEKRGAYLDRDVTIGGNTFSGGFWYVWPFWLETPVDKDGNSVGDSQVGEFTGEVVPTSDPTPATDDEVDSQLDDDSVEPDDGTAEVGGEDAGSGSDDSSSSSAYDSPSSDSGSYSDSGSSSSYSSSDSGGGSDGGGGGGGFD